MSVESIKPNHLRAVSTEEKFRTKILVADDSRSLRLWLSEILVHKGFEVILAKDGYEAVDLYHSELPDLLIIDIVMPKMDGVEALTRIKEMTDEEFIPVIFITQHNDENSMRRCLEIDCDDFISKPFSPLLLIAKINSLLRVKHKLYDQLKQKQKLLAFQRRYEHEQEVAISLSKNYINASFLKSKELRFILSPKALYHGDILLSAKTPGNSLYIFLGDFNGHGLSASIGAAPTAEIFYGMTQKGFGINEIVNEINQKMLNLLPVNMFLAASIMSLNEDTKTLSIMTCGLPDHYLYNKASGKVITISSSNPPIGITESYHPEEKRFEVCSDDFLYLFNDGLLETKDEKGGQFGSKNVLHSLKTEGSGFEGICRALNRFAGYFNDQDQTILLELHCNVENPEWKKNIGSQKNLDIEPISWKNSAEFHISSLRHVNPVPILVNSLMEIQGFKAHREAIFMIISELFANALDHGLLGLNSKMKNDPDGFIQFYELKQERLNNLTTGHIKLSFIHTPIEGGGELTIKVQDTGKGFKKDEIFSALDGNETTYGRGIDLVKRLCKSVEYSNFGSSVKVVYAWSI